ncbi:10320_t:CDS:2, partial [Acaulospora morrowiae]
LSQIEPSKIYRDPNLHLNDTKYLNMSDALECLNAIAKDIFYLQTLMDNIRKEYILDIWNNCEHYQQGGSYDIINKVGGDNDLQAKLTQNHREIEEAK